MFVHNYMIYYFASGFIEHQISPEEKANIIEDLLNDVSRVSCDKKAELGRRF